MRGTRMSVRAISAVGIAMLAGSALLLSACSGDGATSLSNQSEASDDSAQRAPAEEYADGQPESLSAADAQVAGGEATGDESQVSNGLLTDTPDQREIIATAEMTLRSENVRATVEAIESIASSAGGFVSGRDVQSNPDDPDRTRAVVVVRVPTAKIDAVLDAAQAEGDLVRVVSDEQDVTETVVDVNSRVKSAQASVERIRALLSEATTIGEVVRIESELARREADLESLLAQQRSLADQTEMATLSVTVLAPEAVETTPEDEEGFVAGLERGWEAFVNVVVVALTTIGVILPFVVVAALIATPLLLAWRRRRPIDHPAPDAS
jgi:hypothetical protein